MARGERGRAAETLPGVAGATDERLGTILGPYRIEALLGEGGMGRVYRAEHLLLGRRVAIKLLRAEQAGRRSAVARFFQEARLVNRIRHRNIVDVPDLVELPDGTVFIVMELLEGGSLKELLAERSRLDLATTLAIATQICAALAAAHAVGVLHRDLKPANVHIGHDRHGDAWVKLLDFGIAKLSDAEAAASGQPQHVTGEGAIVGTPAYMSPEQATGDPVDARSDLYALGIILFELLTGRTPFVESTLGGYVRAHCSAPVPSLVLPDLQVVPPALTALIRGCLAKTPAERPASVAEVDAVLATLLAAAGSTAPASGATGARAITSARERERTELPPPRRRRAWLAVLLATGVAGAAVAWARRAPAVPVTTSAPVAADPGSVPPSPPPSVAPAPPPAPAAAQVTPPILPAVTPGEASAASTRRPPRTTARSVRPPVRRDVGPEPRPGAEPAAGIMDPAYTADPFGSP